MLFISFSLLNMLSKFFIPFFHIVFIKRKWIWNSFRFSCVSFFVVFIVFFAIDLFGTFLVFWLTFNLLDITSVVSKSVNQRQINKLSCILPTKIEIKWLSLKSLKNTYIVKGADISFSCWLPPWALDYLCFGRLSKFRARSNRSSFSVSSWLKSGILASA